MHERNSGCLDPCESWVLYDGVGSRPKFRPVSGANRGSLPTRLLPRETRLMLDLGLGGFSS